jgi:hypothetical protein
MRADGLLANGEVEQVCVGHQTQQRENGVKT